MGIGKNLKELRKEKGLTLAKVGKAVGVTATAISCYENETRNPSNEMIQKLAKFYNTTPDAIFGYHHDHTNLQEMIKTDLLHWGGVPLSDDQLEFIKHFLQTQIHIQKSKDNQIKNVN